jgi:MFS family permease
MEIRSLDRAVILTVIVAALGYFVDIYDLLLFSIVRVNSLKGLGVHDDMLLSEGVRLINTQMAGLLCGGIIWGILGDKRGRLSVLFGSIFLYSVANLANAFVQTVDQYAALRFLAGIGLAGELGAGVTLVTEILPQKLRGIGTSVVAGIGILGAVFGGLVADFFTWRTAFIVGGVMGFIILVLRVGVAESKLFNKTKSVGVTRGNFLALFSNRKALSKYITVILVGVPIWYVIGVLVTFTPEFAKAFGMTELPTAGNAVMFCYFGSAFGDFFSGIFSHILKSRRRAIFLYILGVIATVTLHVLFSHISILFYYGSCILLGFGCGYWAMFVTVAAEQFGTNIRSTAATTAPNFVRGAVIPLTTLFQYWSHSMGVVQSGVAVGVVCITIALIALHFLEETYHKDLDYNEA